jgi:Protein of unknown function (DUF4058)
MDPYLEVPEFWSEVHNRMIVAIADDLAPKLRPRYRVAIEQRIYLSSGDERQLLVPDVTVTRKSPEVPAIATMTAPITQPVSISLALPEEVKESYLEVREVASGRVVTVLEVLSPKNKRNGEGRIAYERKRQQTLASTVNFVEIDLLRQGLKFPLGQEPFTTEYYVLVARGDRRPQADLYPFTLREQLPTILIPLDSSPAEPVLLLQEIFTGLYDRAGFDLAIDYSQPVPKPALSNADQLWVKDLLG